MRQEDVAQHPLDMLTAKEIELAREILRNSGRIDERALFAYMVLHEPDKELLSSWKPGEPVDRCVRVLIVPGPELDMVEAVVAVADGSIRSWTHIEGMRPGLLAVEAAKAIEATRAHPDYLAALGKRGIDGADLVQIDPWPAGTFGYPVEDGRRIARLISYLRSGPYGNGYTQPVEGLLVHVDLGRNEVIEVVDHGVVPMPPNSPSYYAEDQLTLRSDLKPLDIVQPEGPSFHVTGNRIEWQKWEMRLTFDPYEGLVVHQVAYDDDGAGRVRQILHRASVTEMVVPYGDPSPVQGWKNAFDAGEWGLGRMTRPLVLGCDCLGEIHYLDAVVATEQGYPWTIENAICVHEEDFGILWKHVDQSTGRNEVRRSRRLVVSFVSTVGNYEYGFYWYFYLDGSIQFEVKLTGIASPMAIEPGTQPEFANVVDEGLAAVHHQHLFNARLDFDVDGAVNSVYEVEADPVPPGPDNPWGNAFRQRSRRLDSELQARRRVDSALSRSWKVVNPAVRNAVGEPVAYRLVPTMSTPTLLADPESPVGRRAGFANHNLWVTPHRPDERRAAGEFPNQHPGADGLPVWTEQDRSLVENDIVCWYTFGVTHFVRPEDWPIMPVEYCGFLLVPSGFFDRNPALDVPPSPGSHCHAQA